MKTKEELGEELFWYINSNHKSINTVYLKIVQKYLDDGVDINYRISRNSSYLLALYWNLEDFTVLNFLLEKGIDYEYILKDEGYDKDSPHIKYLQKYHDSKYLKEKLENELKSTDVKTKRSKV